MAEFKSPFSTLGATQPKGKLMYPGQGMQFGGDPASDIRAFHRKQQADDTEYLNRVRAGKPTIFQENLMASKQQGQQQFNGLKGQQPPKGSSFSDQSPQFQDEYNRLVNRMQMFRDNPGMIEDLKDQQAKKQYDRRMAAQRASTPEAQQYAAEKKIFKRTGQRTGSMLEDYLNYQREQRQSQPENVANRAQQLMDTYLQTAQRGGQGGQYQKSQANTLNMLRDTLGRLDPTSTEPLDFRTQNIFDLTSGFLRDQQQQQIQSQLSGLFDRPAAQPLTGFSQGPMTQPIQAAQNPMRDQFGQYKGAPAGAQSSMNQGLLGSLNVPGAPTTRARRMNAPLGFSAPQNMPSDFQNQYGLSQLRY